MCESVWRGWGGEGGPSVSIWGVDVRGAGLCIAVETWPRLYTCTCVPFHLPPSPLTSFFVSSSVFGVRFSPRLMSFVSYFLPSPAGSLTFP